MHPQMPKYRKLITFTCGNSFLKNNRTKEFTLEEKTSSKCLKNIGKLPTTQHMSSFSRNEVCLTNKELNALCMMYAITFHSPKITLCESVPTWLRARAPLANLCLLRLLAIYKHTEKNLWMKSIWMITADNFFKVYKYTELKSRGSRKSTCINILSQQWSNNEYITNWIQQNK